MWLGGYQPNIDHCSFRKLSAIIDHPDYNKRNFDHDYSILKLDSPVNWAENTHIRPVCLPDAGTKYKSGEPVVVTGQIFSSFGSQWQ